MTATPWLEPTPGFGLDHLPYGSFDPGDGRSRLGVRFGARVVDLTRASAAGLVPDECSAPDLSRLLGASFERWAEVRAAIVEMLTDPGAEAAVRPLLHDVPAVEMRLPFQIGDFVDFYSSEAHATNVGRLFRPDAAPLAPNWKYLPGGYHGRSGTVVVSGTPVRRPTGQVRDPDGTIGMRPTRKLDIEVEMGWVVGDRDRSEAATSIADAGRRIFGFSPLNDWSARDIQAWEYVPLGPFLGKSFATTVGGWVTPLAALEPYRVAPPSQDPEPLSHLRTDEPWGVDLVLEALLTTRRMRELRMAPHRLCRVHYRDMYWTVAQQFAHMTSNGASARPGDLGGSGTISGWGDSARGSLLESTRDGQAPFELPDGSSRSFLADGDEVEVTARTPDGVIVLGSAVGRVVAPLRPT